VGWTKFYKGEVTAVNSRDGTYDIKFEDGERKRGVEKSRVRSLDSGSSDRDQDRNRDALSSSGSAPIREGDKVEAKCTGWTKYYKGDVTRVNSDDTYDIKFEDGEHKKSVRSDQIKASSKKIEEGASVRARYRGANGYTRGTISAVNRDGTYDIKYNDGLKESNVERRMIKLDSDDQGFGDRRSPKRSFRQVSPRPMGRSGSLSALD